VAAKVCVYGAFKVPLTNEVVVMLNSADITTLSCLEDVCAGDSVSEASTVKANVPGAVGVPVIAPVALKLSPAGSAPEVMLQL
jgi:hypothetical protein